MNICRNILLSILLLFGADGLSAQHPNEGVELHRTRLVPYHTAEAARQQTLAKQRYLQPIVEWTTLEEGRLQGEFTYPFSWVERQIFLRVEDAGSPYEVWVNGKRAGSSRNGFAAAEFNITKISREDKNRVELRLLSNDEVAPIESFSCKKQSPVVYIISQPRVRVRDVMWRTTLGEGGVVNVDFSAVMHNQTLGAKRSTLYYELFQNDTIRLVGGHLDVELAMYGVDTMRFGVSVPDSVLWSHKAPQRVSLRIHNRIEGRDVEFYELPVALRELSYADGRFYINGEATDMSWYDMSPDATVEDVCRAVDAGHRALRFTAGCVDESVLAYCDAEGVYVAVTAPINSLGAGVSRKRDGNPSNNPSWREEYVERIVQMIHTTKRHSSVVAYFLADDSANGICLYEGYLAAKRVAGDRPVFYLDGGNEWNSD